MGFTLGGAPEDRGGAAVVYCVVPPQLAEIEPRLEEHFAGDPAVEVVVDRRSGERRRLPHGETGDPERAPEGHERRAIDGRRTAVPANRRFPLPMRLRRFQDDVTFRAVQDHGWRRRSIDAEYQAAKLAGALEIAASAMRSPRGLSPRRFMQLTRIEEAVQSYYRWRSATRP